MRAAQLNLLNNRTDCRGFDEVQIIVERRSMVLPSVDRFCRQHVEGENLKRVMCTQQNETQRFNNLPIPFSRL